MAQPNSTVRREPYGRIYQEWDPARIRAARIMSDTGDLRIVADLCESLLLDDGKVAGALKQRILGGLGLKISFDPDGDKRKKTRVTKALEADFWHMFPEAELLQLETWGLLLGVGLARIAPWKPGTREHKGRYLPRLQPWNPRWLRYDFDKDQWYLRIGTGEDIVINPGDGEWVLYTPYGASRPWAWGLWRQLAFWSLAKTYARGDWGRHSEIAGGIRSAKWMGDKTPSGDMLKDRQKMAKELSEIAREFASVPPPGWEYYIVQLVQGTHKTFRELVEVANAEIAVAVNGQTLSSGTDSGGAGLGTGGAADLHSEVKQDFIEFDAEARATFLHDQAIDRWAEVNFGSADLAPWPKWHTEPPEDTEEKAKTWNELGDAIPKLAAQLPIDREKIADEFGIPLREGAPIPGKDGEPEPGAAKEGEKPGEEKDDEEKDDAGDEKKKKEPAA
jgi:phage gp29-like protein